MLLAVALICLMAAIAARRRLGRAGRMQALAEMAYEFIAGMVRSAAGEAGMRFFPLVFSIFFFILICNLIGLLPYSFTVTSHIIVTAALALLVFLTVVIVGIRSTASFLQALRAPGRADLHPAAGRGDRDLLVPVRPVSHSVRLFANMLAGHITLYVFGASSSCCSAPARRSRRFAVLPFAMTIGLDALELLVAFLQAYVFAMLTCMYLNDALHPGGH